MDVVEQLRRDCEFSEFIEIPQEAQHSFALSLWKSIGQGIGGLWHEAGHESNLFTPDQLAYIIARRYSELQQFFNGDRTQSPIERRLLGSLIWLDLPYTGYANTDFLCGPESHFENFGPFECKEILITPQAEICGYRVDFLVWIGYGEKAYGVAIECDGHAFHEKTKEQAARDKRRDREILAAGFAVMRFTGSEIFADSPSCANQVRSVLLDVYERIGGN